MCNNSLPLQRRVISKLIDSTLTDALNRISCLSPRTSAHPIRSGSAIIDSFDSDKVSPCAAKNIKLFLNATENESILISEFSEKSNFKPLTSRQALHIWLDIIESVNIKEESNKIKTILDEDKTIKNNLICTVPCLDQLSVCLVLLNENKARIATFNEATKFKSKYNTDETILTWTSKEF